MRLGIWIHSLLILALVSHLINGQTPNISAAEDPDEDDGGIDLMDLKLTDLLRILQMDPSILSKAASAGEVSVLEKFRNFVQAKLLEIISVPCFADLGFFAQELVEYGTAVYQLTNSCVNSTIGGVDCSCGRKVESDMNAKSWTMSVLDATGRFTSGIFEGNLWLTGNFEQCVNTVHTKNTKGELWEGQYCRIDTSLYGKNRTCSTTYIFRMDTCFPASCTQRDVQALIDSVLQYVSGKQAGDLDLICQTKAICHDKRMEMSKDPPAILILTITILAMTLMLSGALYDYYSYQPVLRTLPKNLPQLLQSDITENGIAASPATVTQRQYADNQSWFVKMLLSFSIYTNGKKLFDTTKRPDQIHCLHGVRFLSMAWIIFGHTYYWSKNYINNIMQAYTLPPKFLNQMLLNGSLAVDAFYLIAAMLLAYLWMREMNKTNGRHVKSPGLWFMFYFHRYVRLTPLYAMILAIDATLIKYVADGPLWNQDGIEGTVCQKSWWTNLLYVNNFFYLDDQCMSWTWYLANDMQFYILSPIFLVLLWWKEIIGIVSIIITILATGIVRAAIILSHENWPPISIFSVDEKQFDLVDPYWKAVYIKPYCRCGPFLVGLLLGYTFYKTELKINIPRWIAHLGWLMAAALGIGIVFGLYDFSNTAYISTVGNVIYGGFARTLWSIALSWVIFASATGYGGPVGAFLSWRVFMPLSKLVYAAYLLHPILIMVHYSSQPKPLHYSGHYHYVSYFLAHLFISFFLALLLSMAFEIPIQGLENIVFGTQQKTNVNNRKTKTEKKSPSDDGETSVMK